MSNEFILGILIGLLSGLLSGLYSGLVIARYARFAELRNEALRVIRAIEYTQENDCISVTGDEGIGKQLLLISSDFLFIHHKNAGTEISRLLRDISTATDKARRGEIRETDYSVHHDSWQKTVRELPPRKRTLWSMWGHL